MSTQSTSRATVRILRTPGDQRIGGFTLVELLVVIGVITVVIALLLPALTKARVQAQKTQCLSNLRQLVQAATMYAIENRGAYPMEGRNNATGSIWVADLRGVGYSLIWPGEFRADMYIAMGFPDPGATPGNVGAPGCSGKPLTGLTSGAWQCPGNAKFSISNQHHQDMLFTSYMYFGNGYGDYSNGSFERDYNMRPRRMGQSNPRVPGPLPLFGDLVEAQPYVNPPANGNWASIYNLNHEFTRIGPLWAGTPVPYDYLTTGANQAFTDGHGEWVQCNYPQQGTWWDGKFYNLSSTGMQPSKLVSGGGPPGANPSVSHANSGNFWGCWWWY